MKRFLVLILLMSCVLSIPRLGAQSTESRPTQPAGSSIESDPLVCIPESELTRIIQEEVGRAVDLAVQQAVAEERGKRVAAEIALENAKMDLDYSRRKGRLGWYVAGSLGVVLVSWFAFELVDVLTPEWSPL